MSGAHAQAFLALWNGITSAEIQREYESWHSFEHVPERVGLPGFVQATRYRAVGQPLRYFTCYRLGTLAALDTPEYRNVFARPTPWSTRMRQVLCDFYRLPCTLGGAHGLGSARHLATLQWRSASPDLSAQLDACLQVLVQQGQAIRAEWGVVLPSDAYWLPNTSNSLTGAGQDHVLMLQHLDADSLQSSLQLLLRFLVPHVSSLGEPEYFEQLTHVRQDELDSPPGIRRPPHTTLYDQFTGD